MSESVKTPPVPYDSIYFRPTPGWFTDAEMKHQWEEDLQAGVQVPAVLVGIIFMGMLLMAIGVLLAVSYV
jgi:hypothetical protein